MNANAQLEKPPSRGQKNFNGAVSLVSSLLFTSLE